MFVPITAVSNLYSCTKQYVKKPHGQGRRARGLMENLLNVRRCFYTPYTPRRNLVVEKVFVYGSFPKDCRTHLARKSAISTCYVDLELKDIKITGHIHHVFSQFIFSSRELFSLCIVFKRVFYELPACIFSLQHSDYYLPPFFFANHKTISIIHIRPMEPQSRVRTLS